MRLTRYCLLTMLIGALATLSPTAANSEIIATSNFVDDGSDGSIDGDTSGIGWAAEGWSVQDPAFTAIVPSTMSYLVPGGGLVSATSAVQFTGPGLGTAIQRDLAEVYDGDDVYISFLTKWETGEVNGNDFVIWYFDTNGGPNIGYKANEGSGDDGPDFVARTGGSTNQYAPDELEIGETYFVVGHLSKSDPASEYDRYELWVNPGINDFDTPESVSDGASNISEFSSIGVRTHQINDAGAEPDDLRFGALTIGTTWADVVPANSDFIAGDFNSDGMIDVADFEILAANAFAHLDGVTGHEFGDMNLDGRIDLADHHQFVENFPAVAAAAQAVPEPSSASLMLLSLVGTLYLKRRRRR